MTSTTTVSTLQPKASLGGALGLLAHIALLLGLVSLSPVWALPDLQNFKFTDLSVEDEPEISLSIPKYSPSRDEIETLAACLVTEAACQGAEGMRGVMSVIRNRSRGLPELFMPTILRPMQFSALNKVTTGRESLYRFVRRAKGDRMWPEAVSLVKQSLEDRWSDPTQGATHYTRSGERTRWTRSLRRTVTINNHSFYK